MPSCHGYLSPHHLLLPLPLRLGLLPSLLPSLSDFSASFVARSNKVLDTQKAIQTDAAHTYAKGEGGTNAVVGFGAGTAAGLLVLAAGFVNFMTKNGQRTPGE